MKGRRPSEAERVALLQAREPRDVKRAALAFVGSREPEDHALLGAQLATPAFLERLDTAESYAGTYTNLRLSRVMKGLSDAGLPSTDAVLLGLLDAQHFQSDVLRMQLAIWSLATVRPSPPRAISYWDRMSSARSPIAYDVISALCRNQSPPALQLLEQKLCDGAHERSSRAGWMRQLILPRRNDVPLLACCERVLARADTGVRADLAEALFDYRPGQWYIGCHVPVPPPRAAAEPEASALQLRMARLALTQLPLDPGQQVAVEIAIEELEAAGPGRVG